jgi:putative ABC transport system permease protein
MKMAARELLRRPRGFAVPAGILVLLALLLLYPSAILDGLNDNTTGALRTAPADLVVYAENAKSSLLRSRIDPRVREQVETADGVAEVSSFDVVLLGALKEGEGEAIGLAVMTSERPIGPDLPESGEAYIDASLRESAGLNEGDTVLVGPLSVPVEVIGFTHDTNLFFQAGMVVAQDTWRQALGADVAPVVTDPAGTPDAPDALAPPGAPEAPELPDQALFISVEPGADPLVVADAVDEATEGATNTITPAQAVASLPGMSQQSTTFGYIRAVTLGVALVVVGLFLSFVTLERTPLYAVLKALGMSSRQLFTGVVTQVLLITFTAALVALAATWGLTHVPLELPTTLRPVRFVETLVALGVTSVVGSILSLRRVVRVDPASAIG